MWLRYRWSAPGHADADLLESLYQRWPRLREWDGSLLLALDQTYVKRDAVLHDGAEVAIMPPVQGG
ncbi:MAG: MoaD/ThiS family protein [Verrucomicrobiaceae bacterium]|nr:MoaD/ThiS family protein [Verrucomicrobiaceae bacterium]